MTALAELHAPPAVVHNRPDTPAAAALLEAADEALYQASQAGRNCVRVYGAAANTERRPASTGAGA